MIDNSGVVLAELRRKVATALDAVGTTAESDVSQLAPIEFGRLRESITHLVDDNTVTIGTNVEYAVYQEFGEHFEHPRGGQAHYMRDGVTKNIGKYQKIINDTLQS